MGGAARSVGGLAGVEAAVLHDGAADVDVGDDLTMEGDVLAHHEPGDGNIAMIAACQGWYNNIHRVCGVLVWIVTIRYAGRHFALLVSWGVLNYQVYTLCILPSDGHFYL